MDLVLLIDGGGLDRKRLRRDIADTFARRKTHEPPASLDSPPDFWRPTFERVATECGLGPDISARFEKVRRFYAGLSPD